MANLLLSVITACSRPQNLELLGARIPTDVRWIVVADGEHRLQKCRKCEFIKNRPNLLLTVETDPRSRWGTSQKNKGLSLVDPESLVYFLDDDNILHPDFLPFLREWGQTDRGLVVSQILKGGQPRCRAEPGCLVPERVDTAQFVLPRKLIGDIPWPTADYRGDGKFVQAVDQAHPNSFDFVDKPLCFYNFLAY